MKFSKTLSSHLTPEWRHQYLNYEGLKDRLYEAIKNSESEADVEEYLNTMDEQFFADCAQQLHKINTFSNMKIAEAQKKYLDLQNIFDAYSTLPVRPTSIRKGFRSSEKKTLRFVFSEFYYSLMLLENFQSLNKTAFRKILKKHDKLFRRSNGSEWFTSEVETSQFVRQMREVSDLILKTEEMFIQLEKGDRSSAMKILRVPPLAELEKPSTMLALGIVIGESIVLVFVIIFSYVRSSLSSQEIEACKHLHRPIFILFIYILLISVNLLGWRKAGVNHILIFELDPRDHLTGCHLMRIAFNICVLWSLSFLGFLYSQFIFVPPYVFPLTLSLLLLFYLLNPLDILHRSSRYWLLRIACRVVIAPFVKVEFADFWLGDQLLSLGTFIQDSFSITCFYLNNGDLHQAHVNPSECVPYAHVFSPIILALPVWFRFAQCLRRYRDGRRVHPFLTNAAKYATIFPVLIFSSAFNHYRDDYFELSRNPLFWSYVISRIVSTTYCYYWDVHLDFGLMQLFKSRHFLLRDEIIYPTFSYYLVMLLDLILRFLWIAELVVTQKKMISDHDAETIFSCLEVFRRYIWNYYRLENEHLNNCGLFRAVRDISINIFVQVENAGGETDAERIDE